jgi:hypothetical protein
MRPTKSIRNKELDERKANGLCFWCDERLVLDHKCKNKKLYSLYIVDDDGKEVEDGHNIVKKKPNPEKVTHIISINALEGVIGFHTLMITNKVDKHPIFIIVDSGSTYNFIDSNIAIKLQCDLTTIKPLVMEATN